MGLTLKDKVAVVTGSGRGIGRAIAMLMAEEGAKVVVNDHDVALDGSGASVGSANEVALEIESRGGVSAANYDTVATMEGGQRIIQTALDRFGKIDILVNNAGVFWITPFVEMTEQEWDTMLQVHLKGHFACTKAAVPHMIAQRSGRIINISSNAARGSPGPGRVHYGTAKAGVLGFTRQLARELGEDGITVNAVMPTAHTRMRMVTPTDQIVPELATLQAPEDVAPIVVYLASDEAANINGATFAARVKGVIQLMSDPMELNGIYKEERWTVADLITIMPKTLERWLVNPTPPKPKE